MSWFIKVIGSRAAVVEVLKEKSKDSSCHLAAQVATQQVNSLGDLKPNQGVRVEGCGHHGQSYSGNAFKLEVEVIEFALDTPAIPPEASVASNGAEVEVASEPKPE